MTSFNGYPIQGLLPETKDKIPKALQTGVSVLGAKYNPNVDTETTAIK